MNTYNSRTRGRLGAMLSCLAVIVILTTTAFGQGDCSPANPLACRPLVPPGITAMDASPMSLAAGYCWSDGGSTYYESINSVSLVQDQDKLTITVNVYIANPTGCTAGNAPLRCRYPAHRQ